MAVEAHDGPWSADITTATNTAAPSTDNSTSTASSVQLGQKDPEKAHPEDNDDGGHDPEKLGAVTENAAPAAAAPPSLPPDGGLKAWLVVAGAFCSLFVSFGWINCKFVGL